jgi:hypothetical protein
MQTSFLDQVLYNTLPSFPIIPNLPPWAINPVEIPPSDKTVMVPKYQTGIKHIPLQITPIINIPHAKPTLAPWAAPPEIEINFPQ